MVEQAENGQSRRYIYESKLLKVDPSGFVKLQLVVKYEKKMKESPLGPWIFFKKSKMRFSNSLTLPKM